MNPRKEQSIKILEFSLPWLVLVILLTYTYAKFFEHPYGFGWDYNGSIERVFVIQQEPTLRLGDQLVQVGPLRWDEYRNDLHKTLFEGVQPGEIEQVTVERNGDLLTIPWRLPGTNSGEVMDQLFSEWPLAFVFWLAGTLTLLFLRPRDARWLLLSTFNFLTAIWLAAGGGASSVQIWESALVLRMAIWLSVPVYLHLHWFFPRPLGRLPRALIGAVYGLALIMVFAQWFQLISPDLYFLGFLAAILGSLLLIAAHAVYQPDTRKDLRVLLLAAFFILVPVIVLAVIQAYSRTATRIGSLALLTFPLLPFGYLYTAYRRQLGGLEVRVNRLISAYFFMILLGTVALPVLLLLYLLFPTADSFLVAGFLTGLVATVLAIWGFPIFQNYVERRWLGITLPGKNLPQIYSARITTSGSLAGLLRLLEKHVFPSLLIRQYAFVHVNGAAVKVMLSENVTGDQVSEETLKELVTSIGPQTPLRFTEQNQALGWVRLVIPLQLDSKLIGAWLLGRRDPDDNYLQPEIPVLQSLADQTAIALSNILQTERLRSLYQVNIDRHEQERLHLAMDLHDSILNQLAILSMEVDPSVVSRKSQKAYDELTQRLREIVNDLRPPMLQYGLKPAFEGLADNLMERSKDKVSVAIDMQAGEDRYPQNIEVHLFRIVQQACENALRHGQPEQITISGSFDPQKIELTVEDNGIGFDAGQDLDLNTLLANKHFGLAGMIERANLIGARLEIDAAPQAGTRIHINWAADES